MNQDRIAGAAKVTKARVQEAIGKAIGDAKLEADGRSDKAEGKAQKTAGKVQNAVGGMKDAMRGK